MFFVFNIAIKQFVIDIFHVSGNSMYPTIQDGDNILVLKCCYNIRKPRTIYEIPWIGILINYCVPRSLTNSILKSVQSEGWGIIANLSSIKRGDIIAFNIPQHPNQYAVKRCVALPGETIEEYIKEVKSPWLTPFSIIPYKGMKIKMSELSDIEKKLIRQNTSFKYSDKDSCYIALNNFYLVLGDNRIIPEDSRLWGCIPEDHIIGKAVNMGKIINLR